MDSDNIPVDLLDAFTVMQQQVEAVHAAWTTTLVERYPELAERLEELYDHYCAKHERIEALLLLFVANPSLPIETMLRQYSAILEVIPAADYADKDAGKSYYVLGSRQRSALTKRRRTRESLINAAVKLITEGKTEDGCFETRIVELSGVSIATMYNHFRSKATLLAAAYERLLEPLLYPK